MEYTAASQLMASIGPSAPAGLADFESAVARYRPKIFRFALASLRDRDAAETVAQDCLLKAYRARDGFRNECSLDTWLMQIAVNLIRDHVRNRRWQFWRRTQLASEPCDQVGDFLPDGGCSPENRASLKQRVDAVWEAASHLSERQRTVFLLRFVEDLDLLEIAAVTGMKEPTVKTHLARALRIVRERLGERA